MAELMGGKDFKEQKQQLEADLKRRIASGKLPTANIMVAGITGTGKSTLINSIFGEEMAATGSGRPVTDRINEYQNGDIPIHIYDTVGLELDSQKTRESIKAIKNTIASKATSPSQYDRVHAIWYCINSGSNRYQGAELEFIKELHSIGVPFIIVLTQCSGDEDLVNRFENSIQEENRKLGMSDINTVQVLAQPVKYRGMPVPIEAFGLDTLVKLTTDELPAFIKRGFIAAQKVCRDEKRAICEEIIFDYVQAAKNGFWDKVPMVNVFVTDSNIKNMIHKLGETYNTILSDENLDKIIKSCAIKFSDNFWGLISPVGAKYSKKITALIEEKKMQGFSGVEVEKNERAARMIAYFGYLFASSIERVWANSTQEQLKDIDRVVQALINVIKEKMEEKR